MVGDCILQFITACYPARRSALRGTTFEFVDTTGSACRLRCNTVEAEFAQFEFIDKDINHSDCIVLDHKIVKAFGQQRVLVSIDAFDETLHRNSPRSDAVSIYLTARFSHTLGRMRQFIFSGSRHSKRTS
jgi:hypothetical protein